MWTWRFTNTVVGLGFRTAFLEVSLLRYFKWLNNFASRNLLRRRTPRQEDAGCDSKKLYTFNKLPPIHLTEHHDPLIGMRSIKIAEIHSKVRKPKYIVWSHLGLNKYTEKVLGRWTINRKQGFTLERKWDLGGIGQSNAFIFLLSIFNFFSFLAKTKQTPRMMYACKPWK